MDHSYTVIMVAKESSCGNGVDGHIVSIVKRQRAMDAGTHLASPFSNLHPQVVPPTFRYILSLQLEVHRNTIKDMSASLFLG